MFEIELFLHLTLCKQKNVLKPVTNRTYAKLNCLKLSETI